MPEKYRRHPEDIFPDDTRVLQYLGLIADLTVKFIEDPTVIGIDGPEDYTITIERPEIYQEAIEIATSPELNTRKRIETLSALHWRELSGRFHEEPEPGVLPKSIWTNNPHLAPKFKRILLGIGRAYIGPADKVVHPVTRRPRNFRN